MGAEVGFRSHGGGVPGRKEGAGKGAGKGAGAPGGGGVRSPSSRPDAGLGPEEGGHAGLGTFPGPCARPPSHLGTVDPLFPQPPT